MEQTSGRAGTMREILFRGKVKYGEHAGEWIYGQFLLANNETPIMHISVDDGSHPYGCNVVDLETVGQFTGLYDKNGTRIFEGDIVKYGDTIHQVVFEQRNNTAYFGLVYSTIETLPFGHYQDLRQIEVIGNIHDNPDLLE